MKFALASQRSNKVLPKGDQLGLDTASEEDRSRAKVSIAWAIAASIAALGPIAWAIAAYLIEHEKQRVELARLELEAKKQAASST